MKLWKKIFIFLFLLFIINFISIRQHELVHVQILKWDGCSNTKIHYGFDSGYTTCNDYNYTASQWARDRHIDNEIIGYNFMFLVYGILMVCIFAIIYKMEEKNEKKNK